VQVFDDGVAVQQRGFGLLHDDAAFGQYAVAIAEEVGLEQAFRRAHRVGGVHDDHVHAAVVTVAHVLHAVFEQQLGAAVAVGLAQFREVFLGIAGDHFVDVDLGGFFHAGVTQHFTQGAAVAATDDDDALGVGVAEQHRVRHHLVVEEVVAGGEHGGAINGHQVAEGVGFPHLDVLILGLHFFQLLFEAKAEGGAGGVEVLVKPVVFGAAHGGFQWSGVGGVMVLRHASMTSHKKTVPPWGWCLWEAMLASRMSCHSRLDCKTSGLTVKA